MARYCIQCGKQLHFLFGRGLDYSRARNDYRLSQILADLSLGDYPWPGQADPSDPFPFAPDRSAPTSWRWCSRDCAAQWLGGCLSRKRVHEAAERRREEQQRARERTARRGLLLSRIRAAGYVGNLKPRQFESVVLNIFRAQGWNAEATPVSGDQGIDGHLTKGRRVAAVQCKHQSGAVGEPAVRDFVGALEGRDLTEGFFVTSSQFTPSAYNYARRIGDRLHLIDGRELAALIERYFTSEFVLSEEFVDVEVPGQKRKTRRAGRRKSPYGPVDRVLNIPRCKRCGESMELLSNEEGYFWGCSQWPDCVSYRRPEHVHLEWVRLGVIEARTVGPSRR